MTDFQIITKGLLSLLILVPLTIGLIKFKEADFVGRLFVLFLALGMSVDLTMWRLLSIGQTSDLLRIFNFYSLLEALFFFWFISKTSLSVILRRATNVCLYGIIPVWIFCDVVYPLFVSSDGRGASFDVIYEVLVSFLAGFSLLRWAESDDAIGSSYGFWLTVGIFFYCFCTFFIMFFLETVMASRLWFLNNIFNVIAYVFYVIGFLKLKNSKDVF